MELIEILLIATQVELIAVIIILIWHINQHKKHKKPDQLLKHVKELISDGMTLKQAREKLETIGFDTDRINKVMTDFLRH